MAGRRQIPLAPLIRTVRSFPASLQSIGAVMKSLDKQLVAPIAPTITQRNVFFDELFYDVGSLTSEEKNDLSPFLDREGTIIVVPPRSSEKRISHYRTVGQFLWAQRETIRAVAIAGVGSSVLGTAALARNVADAYDIDVAGIVSGYGASDLIAEAMGGWFFYGATDAIRHGIRETVNWWEKLLQLIHQATRSGEEAVRAKAALEPAQDLDVLSAILDASPPNLGLLVGHSKGDLLLDFALERFARRFKGTAHPYFEQLRIVTFGAVTDLPPQFKMVHQFLGDIDWFGAMNSRLDICHTKVSDAWHHLNTTLPFHLSAESVLKQYVSME